MEERPIAFLFIDQSGQSRQAEVLCRELKVPLRIVDVSDEPKSEELPIPRLITPEGRFISLKGVKDYVKRYGKPCNNNKTSTSP